jgi:Zn-dependent protease
MSKLRVVALFSISIIIFIASFGMNILAHEAGHYAVAKSYGLEPKLHINEPTAYAQNFWSADSSLAYVSYQSSTADIMFQDFLIASAGPAVNLLILALSLFAYKKTDHNSLKLFLVSPIVISIMSVIANIYPISPTDGYILFSYLL